jgi:hypothetical protein
MLSDAAPQATIDLRLITGMFRGNCRKIGIANFENVLGGRNVRHTSVFSPDHFI